MGKQYSETQVYARNMGMDLRQSYDAQGRVEYVGYATPGALDSDARWQIVKLGYDSNNRLTHRRYADKTDDHIKIWDNRSSYDYVDL